LGQKTWEGIAISLSKNFDNVEIILILNNLTSISTEEFQIRLLGFQKWQLNELKWKAQI